MNKGKGRDSKMVIGPQKVAGMEQERPFHQKNDISTTFEDDHATRHLQMFLHPSLRYGGIY